MKESFSFLFLILWSTAFAQVTYTANDSIRPYEGTYRPGVNPGYHGGNWDNYSLTDLAAGNQAVGEDGVGVKAIRGSLPESFGLVWTYDAWKNVYEYYRALGVADNTLFVGYAHPEHRDTVDYCPDDPEETQMFLNLYEPIWDNGEQGTPINEHNYFARYIYTLVTKFNEDVRFWEVWNEPGYDLSGYKSWLQPGQDGNWWENDPEPCDIIIRAPIHHFIRTMRITYEVIKSVAPEDYIVLAGVGNDSFLDALLRNTDNPNGGAITADFPLTAGAYFDVMGLHVYPSIDGSIRAWNNTTSQFDYFRHSDAAIAGYENRIDDRQGLLGQYGYDGITFPKKLWTVTEINVSRKQFDNSFGSDTLQRHYVIKAAIKSIDLNVIQTHIYDLAERRKESEAVGEFDLMGMYKYLRETEAYNQEVLDEGIAYRTVSKLLFGSVKDSAQTVWMNLPAGILGGAYRKPNNDLIYVLWAATHTDLSEEASAVYSFPSGAPSEWNKKEWDYAETLQEEVVASTNINLSASPIFLTEEAYNQRQLTMECPSGREIELGAEESAGGAIANWDLPIIDSDCDNVQLEQVTGLPSGSFFSFGTNTVSYKATDDCGNVAHCATLIKIASTGGGAGSCHPHRWNFHFSGNFRGHNYFQSKVKRTYPEAQAIAASHGGYLVAIETEAENDFLSNQIFEVAYIGLNDVQEEGHLVWDNGEELTFAKYDTCSWCGFNTDANDYGEFHPWNGAWSFSTGDFPAYFIMELPCVYCDCPEFYEPVCGSDSVTYDNACFAECKGIYEYTDGACDISVHTAPLVSSISLDMAPNPVSDFLKLDIPIGDYLVVISGTNGTPVKQYRLNGNHSIDISQIAQGAYLLELFTVEGKKLGVGKLIKN